MLEYEKKIMLTIDEYEAIVTMCNCAHAKTQINYYFDNDDLSFNENGITCRIRVKDGKYKATVKNHNTEHSDCSIEVDLVEKAEFDPQIFNIFGLHHQGELMTDRIVMHKDSACEMVLDRNIYLGHKDFELEIEYNEESESRANEYLENIAESLVAMRLLNSVDDFLERIGKGKSKSQRFFEHLKKCK